MLTAEGWRLGVVGRLNTAVVTLIVEMVSKTQLGPLTRLQRVVAEVFPKPNEFVFEAHSLTRLPETADEMSEWPNPSFFVPRFNTSAPIRRPKELHQQLVSEQATRMRLHEEDLILQEKENERPRTSILPPTPVDQDEFLIPGKETKTVEVFDPVDDDLIEEIEIPAGQTEQQGFETFTRSLSGVDVFATAPAVNFMAGHQTSLPVAALTGAHLDKLLLLEKAVVPEVAWTGMMEATHKEHLRYLNTISAAMPNNLKTAPLPDAILETISQLRLSRNWKWSTTLKAAASTQGALSLLPLYKAGAIPITLTRYPVWRQGIRTFQRACKEEKPNQPTPATKHQILSIVGRYYTELKRPDIASVLLLGWLTAARLGCVLQLAREDVVFNHDSSVSVTFRRGKGVRVRGPYTVHATHLPEKLLTDLRAHVEQRHTKLFPRHLTGDILRVAIKRFFPNLEQRSLRRGALQAMAAAGVSEETLMRYSGHTRLQTLHRYLSWNSVNKKVSKEMQSAGKVLVK